jgi:hypothetical protein
MHLNQLYGIFGRKQELIETINVYNDQLLYLSGSRIIKHIIPINDEISTVLLHNNIESNIITKINSHFESNFTSFNMEVKSNVAIASAVTAYARIHMIPFKLLPGCVYTDTDSIFTTDKLSDLLIGDEIGLMKDELNGKIIEEAYFLGIKQYGYWYLDENNVKVEKSIFAGVTRNSITFEEIKMIFNGNVITKHIETRFFKSFKNLSINIKPTKVSIKLQNLKELVNNNYLPVSIKNSKKDNNLNPIINNMIKLITKILGKINLFVNKTKF